ncbi:MAG TPA: M48 family metalloprotease [Candidatus Acidoferrales bacterium]|nr:M48 family metalloprotease [Candidatus Acidoferrales bacterium]
MKHRVYLLVAVLLAAVGLVMSEMRKPDVPVSPAPLLFFLADTQRELTRMPMAVTRLPDDEEIRIGSQLAREYEAMFPRVQGNAEAQAVQDYIQKVGTAVAQHAHRKLPYQFHYVPDVNFINAFALPGGHVFIGEGLLALMTTEDALAAILGHEIEHIDHYHCAERLQIELAMRRIPLAGVAALPVAVFVAGYTKDQELEADREGAKLAAAAGYSPLEVIAVFEEFDKLYKQTHDRSRNPAEEVSRVAMQTLEGYFRSHPLPQERIAAVRREVGSLPAPPSRPLEFQEVFARDEAVKALAEGRYGAASLLATRVLTIKPDDLPALKALAEARFALRDYAGALANYGKLSPLDAEAASDVRAFAVQMASAALQRQDLKLAAELAQHAMEFEPVSLEAYLLRIRALLLTGDVDAAWETTQQLMKIAPGGHGELPEVARSRAEQLMKLHDYAQAERLAGYALRILPEDPDYLPEYGRAAFAAGDFAHAADAFLKLCEVMPQETAASSQGISWHAALAAATDAFAASGDMKRGVAALEAARARQKPRDPARDAVYAEEIAGLKLFSGDDKDAKRYADYIRAGHWAEIPVIGLDRIGWWYYRAGQPVVAVALLSRLVGVTPNTDEVILELGWAQLEAGSYQPALASFRRSRSVFNAWRLRADDPLMGLALGEWLGRDAEQALRDFTAEVREHPEWLNAAWAGALYPRNTVFLADSVNRERLRREAVQKTLGQSHH